ncbi:EAL domain-containing protein [Eubacteriales bacterium OttesenSCG-928-M02]|nr:EAL domain-containing protein [Eubacteriales bacterium OttesenSCG-928-M02]
MMDKVDLGQVIEHIPAVVLRLSHQRDDWKTWFVTNNIQKYGYSRAELMDGRVKWMDLVHPDDRVLLSKQIQDYEDQGIDEFRLYYRLVNRAGDVFPVAEYNTVNRAENGDIYCYDTVIMNAAITEPGRMLIDQHYRQQLVLNDILLSLHDSDLDHALQIILDRTGEYLDTSRALLFQDSPDHTTCKVVYEWCNKGITSVMDLDYSITYATEMPEIYVALQDTGILLVNYGEIPENCREEFEAEGLIASAIFAVYTNGKHYGFVCFDDCVVERTWDADTARFLKNISNLISTVLVRQEAAVKLEQSQRTCETVLDNVESYIFATLPESNEIIFANKAFRLAFGEDCVGKESTLYLSLGQKELAKNLADPRLGDIQVQPEIFCEATQEWLAISTEMATWVDGRRVQLTTCYDITSKKMYEDGIERMAYQDHLTGLSNRFRCDVDLGIAIKEAALAGKKGHVLFIDLDDFKVVNDCYGHEYGDGVLKTFANYIENTFKPPNKVYRFGGDEFLVLVDYTNEEKIQLYLDILMERAQHPWKAMDREFYCTLSIGVVAFSGEKDSLTGILKNADIAMYEAKRNGKNSYAFYEQGLDDETLSRSRMEDLLRQSMEDDFHGFHILYQPILDTETEAVLGAEALVRMCVDGEIIPPDDFLSLADYLGLIIPIGEHVLENAMAACKRINEMGYPDFFVTVNLSQRQLSQKDIMVRMEDLLDKSGVNPENIHISLGEDTVIEAPERMMLICTELRKKGIAIVLDGFGGGNSSFIRLRELPIDIIKTAPDFVHTIEDSFSQNFIELIVRLAHSMDKLVCINGVEDEKQLAACKSYGADKIQGFYLHQPLEKAVLEELLTESKKRP